MFWRGFRERERERERVCQKNAPKCPILFFLFLTSGGSRGIYKGFMTFQLMVAHQDHIFEGLMEFN